MWGRVRSKKAAAKAESAALEADYEFARQSLAAAVARAYFSTIEAAQQAANAQETMSFYDEALKLADVRKEQGHASDFDLAQIKARAAGAQDALYIAQAARAQAIRAIEVVTSHYPAGRLSTRSSFPDQPRCRARRPARATSRTPARHHRRRAPLRRRLSSRERSARRAPAALLPSAPRRAWAARHSMPSARWMRSTGASPLGSSQPIFFGGELKAVQDIRTAEQKAAAASYTATALRAFEDVEDALAGDYYLRKREGALTDVVGNSATSVKLAGEQLEQGETDTFTILRLAGENLAAKIELTQIRASRLRERVNLHLALGGDFKGTDTFAK